MHKIILNLSIWLFLFGLSNSSYSFNNKVNKLDLASEQIFHRGNGEEPQSLDPHKSTGVPANNILLDLYEGLMTYDQSGKLMLGQAESYKISNDLKTYTFKLKENLKWSNGDKLSSCDFAAGMRRTVNPSVGSIYSDILKPIKNAEKIINGQLKIQDLAIKCPDDKTLEIQLEKPTPYFLEILTHSTSYPIYEPSLEKYGDQFTLPSNSVTNGAFKLTEWVVNSHITLEKNDYYRDANQVILNKVIFYPIAEQSVELKRYRAGDIDFTNAIPDVQFNWIKQNLNKELYIEPNLATYYYGFNLEQPPFKNNVNLRKAVSLSIDKKIIAEKVLRSGQVATDFLVPDKTNNYIDDYNNINKNISYISTINNPNRLALAKDFYKRAGYSKTNPANIKITYNTQESHKNIAIAIAAMLKKNLGIQTELYNQEWKVFLRTRQERKETQLFREGWNGDYNDPTTFLELYTSKNPQNHGGYKNPEYDKLIEQASIESDLTKRAVLLNKAENILLEDAVIIPLYTYVSRHLVKPYIGGFRPNLLDKIYDKYIYIKKS